MNISFSPSSLKITYDSLSHIATGYTCKCQCKICLSQLGPGNVELVYLILQQLGKSIKRMMALAATPAEDHLARGNKITPLKRHTLFWYSPVWKMQNTHKKKKMRKNGLQHNGENLTSLMMKDLTRLDWWIWWTNRTTFRSDQSGIYRIQPLLLKPSVVSRYLMLIFS